MNENHITSHNDTVANTAVNAVYKDYTVKPVWWHIRCDDSTDNASVVTTITYGTTSITNSLPKPEVYSMDFSFSKGTLLSIIPLDPGETLDSINMMKLVNVEGQVARRRDEIRNSISSIIEEKYRNYRDKDKYTESLRLFEGFREELRMTAFLEAFIWLMRKPRSRNDIRRLAEGA